MIAMSLDSHQVYRILGVAEDASFHKVKKAYRRAALRLHPDKNPDNVEAATQEFQALQSGFRALEERAEQEGLQETRKKKRERAGYTKCFKESFRMRPRWGGSGWKARWKAQRRQRERKEHEKAHRKMRQEKEAESFWREHEKMRRDQERREEEEERERLRKMKEE